MDFKKQVEQMAALMRYVEGDLVSKKAFGEFINALTTIWNELKGKMDDQFRTHYMQVGDALVAMKRELVATQREQRREILDKMDVDNRKSREQLQNAVNKLYDNIREVERTIPPEADLTTLENKIAEVERKIPKVQTLPEVWDAIEDIKDELEKVRKEKQKAPFLSFNSMPNYREVIKDYDLSAQLDGVTTTFNIPAVYNVISVALSSYPYGSLRKGVDYAWTPTSITFLSTIDPATQLSSGQSCVLTIVTA